MILVPSPNVQAAGEFAEFHLPCTSFLHALISARVRAGGRLRPRARGRPHFSANRRRPLSVPTYWIRFGPVAPRCSPQPPKSSALWKKPALSIVHLICLWDSEK